MKFYLRATGDNRFAGDSTSRWLKIRNFAKYPGHGYEIAVQIQGRTKMASVSFYGNAGVFISEAI